MREGASPTCLASIALVSMACRGSDPVEVSSPAPPASPDAAIAPPPPPPSPAFTLLVQPVVPMQCHDEEPPLVVVACRPKVGAVIQRTCDPLPRGAKPASVIGSGDGDYAVWPADVDLTAHHHHAAASTEAPGAEELEAIVATLLRAGENPYRFGMRTGTPVEDARIVVGSDDAPHDEQPRAALAALTDPTIQASYTLDLTGDGREDRLYLVHALAMDSRGDPGSVRALVAIDASAPSAPVFVAGVGDYDVQVRGSFAFDGAPPLVWIELRHDASFCYSDHVLQLRGDEVGDTMVYSTCCDVTW